MKERIIGIDLARALAVIGMIIVNFKIVLGSEGGGWVLSFSSIFDGKAAATFVVLAGVGIALISKSTIEGDNIEKIKNLYKKIFKRALFLFVIGVSYIVIWPADILHFYALYMVITAIFLKSKDRTILIAVVFLILIYPILLLFLNYETAWNFTTFEYYDFWTVKGFIRNLFFNGFHPVIPWSGFMLFGYWFGKQKINDSKFLKKTSIIGLIVFIIIQILSPLLISILSDGDKKTAIELSQVIGTSPMPPLPIYMINGISIALVIISLSILIGKKFPKSKIVDSFSKMGQLALTFYVLHVIVGMGIIEVITPEKMGKYSIEFSISYSLLFSFLAIIFAVIWRKYKKVGPLEGVMKKIIG